MAPRPHNRRTAATAAHGFTLIELLVAISLMALLALMSWRGLDGMARAQTQNKARGDAVLSLQTTLAQWRADLDGAVALPATRALDWDGQVLRVTRNGNDGMQPVIYVVAWTLRNSDQGSQWSRWQSAALTGRSEWQQAWAQAAAWAQDGGSASSGNNGPGGSALLLMPLEGWQLLYFRNNAWGPAINSDQLGQATPLPDGLRLQLQLPPGAALAGQMTIDWVRPTASIPKPS